MTKETKIRMPEGFDKMGPEAQLFGTLLAESTYSNMHSCLSQVKGSLVRLQVAIRAINTANAIAAAEFKMLVEGVDMATPDPNDWDYGIALYEYLIDNMQYGKLKDQRRPNDSQTH